MIILSKNYIKMLQVLENVTILSYNVAIITLSLLLPGWARDNAGLHSKSNISKPVRRNVALFWTVFFIRLFNNLSNDIHIDKLFGCGSLAIDIEPL